LTETLNASLGIDSRSRGPAVSPLAGCGAAANGTVLCRQLSNLDAKLRLELRDDIRDLQRSLGITTIYVTHDQEEALVISNRICIIVLMLFIRRLPYAVRSSAAILKQIKASLEEAAVSLGASPARAFARITLPLMLLGVVAGVLMSFITAINELSSSLILYVGRTMTMPVRIYLSVLDGEFGTAAALSTILLIASGVAVYAVFRVSGRNENAFL
jgi:iron(III) transport system permease protein